MLLSNYTQYYYQIIAQCYYQIIYNITTYRALLLSNYPQYYNLSHNDNSCL